MRAATLFMLMLTCGFGVAVTPMIWGIIGDDAFNRKINFVAPSRTFTYVDDFIGAGSRNDTAQDTTHSTRMILSMPSSALTVTP